ncbi:MAG: hypothetical protein ACK5JO_10255 [Halodesulfovibrio sp.]
MKRFTGLFALVLTLLLSGQAVADDWKKLGEKSVNLSRDYDEIRVNDLKKYDYLKIKVKDQGVEFRKVIVVFGNGKRHELPVRKYIAKNGETMALRLPKGDRYIRKIILDYKTRGGADKRSRVSVYGKRS